MHLLSPATLSLHSSTILVGLVLASAVALIYLATAIPTWQRIRSLSKSKGCKPPQVSISTLTDLYSNFKISMSDGGFHDGHMQRHAKYGPTYESSLFGFAKFIYTSDPENVRAILATDFARWGMGDRRRIMLHDVIVNGIFVNDGERWEHSRSLLRPSFKKVNAENTDFFETHFQHLLQAMPSVNPFSGLVDVDLQPLFFRMTHDSATELFLGQSMNCQLAPPDSESGTFLEAFDYIIRGVLRNEVVKRGALAPLGVYHWLCRGGKKDKYERSCEYLHKVIDQKIDERLKDLEADVSNDSQGRPEKYVFLKEISQQTEDKIRIRDEIISVLFAGRDSTGSLLSNAMFMLARRPDVWDKLQTEIQNTFQGCLPESETLRQMKVLKNVLNETLRLYPPVPANFRAAMVDTTLPRGGGPDGQSPIFVPAGTGVWYHPHTFHRSVDVFGSNANEWEPSRWNDPALKPGWSYIPFNGGPRICPGQTFAMAEASYILARMVQEFKSVERRDPQLQWQPRVSLATVCKLGVKVALAKA